MPTIVDQIGGLSAYSWAFAVYLLASTTSVPLFGKLSDLYGLRRVYAVAMAVFLVGSVLCGLATTMPQLIAFRALQGLGAGGVLPLAFIIIGAMFTLERRARIQGLFSSVWGVSSIVGPLLGGFIVDRLSWPWVFYINVAPGLMALALIWGFLDDESVALARARVRIDYAGAVLLTSGVVALLLGLYELRAGAGGLLIAVAAVIFAALVWVERRAADPVLPIALFRHRLFATACSNAIWSGWATFGIIAFVPLYVQAVLGRSATEAGATLTPMSLGWVTASIFASRALLRVGHRRLALVGMSLLTLGTVLLGWPGAPPDRARAMLSTTLIGTGMGMTAPAFTIAVQSSVARNVLGTATSTLQFSRTIGGALGVGVMGAVLGGQLVARLVDAGRDPAAVSMDRVFDLMRGAGTVQLDAALRNALGGAIQDAFLVAMAAALLALASAVLSPRGRPSELSAAARVEGVAQPVAEQVDRQYGQQNRAARIEGEPGS
jgi:EmrB/QacA subfamily drug resistance transporter